MSRDEPTTRREFLRAAARGGALAALGGLAAALIAGRRHTGCTRSRCDGCPELADCRLPAAEAARKERPRR